MKIIQIGNDKPVYYKGILQKAARTLHSEVIESSTKYLKMGETVLDFGCGEGAFSQRLKDTGYKVDACDIDGGQLKAAVDSFVQLDLNNENILVNFKQTYQVIFSMEVIEHVENQWKFMRDIKSLLKPGGYLILTTPNVSHFASRIRFLLRGTFLGFETQDFDHGHISPINGLHLEYIFANTGFEIVEKKYLIDIPLFHFQNISVFMLFRNILGPLMFPFMKGAKRGRVLYYVVKIKKEI